MRVVLTEDGDEVRLQQVDHRLEPDRPLGAPGQLAVAAVEGLGPELPQHGLHHLQDGNTVAMPRYRDKGVTFLSAALSGHPCITMYSRPEPTAAGQLDKDLELVLGSYWALDPLLFGAKCYGQSKTKSIISDV